MKASDIVTRGLLPGQAKVFNSEADIVIVSGSRGIGKSVALRSKLSAYLQDIAEVVKKKPRYEIFVFLGRMEEAEAWYKDLENSDSNFSINRSHARVLLKEEETTVYIKFNFMHGLNYNKFNGLECDYLIADLFQPIQSIQPRNSCEFPKIFERFYTKAWMTMSTFSAAMTADAWYSILAYTSPLVFRHSKVVESINLNEEGSRAEQSRVE